MRKLSGIAGLVLLLALAAPRSVRAQDDAGWLLAKVNELRASVGVPAYSLNAQLSAAAQQHTEYMATSCDIAHTEANGSTPSSRAAANGYGGSRVSENIYGGPIARASDAWNFWINSGVHYAGMVNAQDNEIGIGIASGDCGHFFTLLFGYRSDVSAPPAPPAPAEAPAAAAQGDAAAAAPPPPTAVPYVPPPPSRTPTPTIPTLTPSATWTITPTYTVSPTGTYQPPTATPLILPTVAAPGQEPVAVAVRLSPTAEPPTVSPQPSATPLPTATPAAVTRVAVHASHGGDGFQARDLLPFALAGQVVLIGVIGYFYFRRAR